LGPRWGGQSSNLLRFAMPCYSLNQEEEKPKKPQKTPKKKRHKKQKKLSRLE
jgi:hypothetical protein